MFDIFFYVMCWLVMLILALPIVFAGLLSIALENNDTSVAVNNPLMELHKEVLTNKDDKTKIQANYKTFINNFIKCAKNDSNFNIWLDIIYNFSINSILMEAEEVAKFRDRLEDENPNIKKEIQNKVGIALKHRKDNKGL